MGQFGPLALLPFLIGPIVLGALLVAIGQIMRAAIDSADYNRQLLVMTAHWYDEQAKSADSAKQAGQP